MDCFAKARKDSIFKMVPYNEMVLVPRILSSSMLKHISIARQIGLNRGSGITRGDRA